MTTEIQITTFQSILKPEQAQKLKTLCNTLFIISGTQILTGPLERVKLLMQTRDSLNKLGKQIPSSSISCFSKIIREQGFRSLWQGSRLTINKNVLQIGITVWMYDSLKRISFPNGEINYTGRDRFLRRIWSGFNCGSFTLALLYPLELLRVYASCEMKPKKEL